MLFSRLKKYEQKLGNSECSSFRKYSIPAVSALLIFATKGLKAETFERFHSAKSESAEKLMAITNNTVDAYAERGTVIGTITGGNGAPYTFTNSASNDNALFTIVNGDQLVVADDLWKYGRATLNVEFQDASLNSLGAETVTVVGLPQAPALPTRKFVPDFTPFELRDSEDAKVADMDNDGDLDIVVLQDTAFTIYYNFGDGTFPTKNDFAAGSRYDDASEIEIVDLDNDGNLDIVIAGNFGTSGSFNNEYPVFFNEGGGVFSNEGGGDLSSVYWDRVKVADFDNDGDFDILVKPVFSNPIQIFANYGARNFVQVPQVYVGISSYNIYFIDGIGDFDKDGDVDVAVSGYFSGYGEAVFVYSNNGYLLSDPNSKFSLTPTDTISTRYTEATTFFDFDGDGDLDMTQGTYESSGYATFKNGDAPLGFYDFGNPFTYDDVYWTAAGDYDGDGDVDLFASNKYFGPGGEEELLTIHANDGNGNFGPPEFVIDLPTRSYRVSEIIPADFDGDGDLDVFVSFRYAFSSENMIFFNEDQNPISSVSLDNNTVNYLSMKGTQVGSLSFTEPDGDDVFFRMSDNSSGNGPQNGFFTTTTDGRLILNQELNRFPGSSMQIEVEAYDQFGDVFQQVFTIDIQGSPSFNSLGTFFTQGFGLGVDTYFDGGDFYDYDNDGDLDVIASDNSNIFVINNDGPNQFTAVDTLFANGNFNTIYDIAVADYDLDGDGDILLSKDEYSTTELFINNGVDFLAQNITTNGTKYSNVWVDFDRDGDLDFFGGGSRFGTQGVVTYVNDLGFLYSNGGTFINSSGYSIRTLRSTDFDNDGDTDLAFVAGNFVRMFDVVPSAYGSYGNQIGELITESFNLDMEIADVNGDGFQDVVTTEKVMFYNESNGNFVEGGQTFSAAFFGGSYPDQIELADMDGDGDIDMFLSAYSGEHKLLLNDGNGTFSDSGLIFGTPNYTDKLIAVDIDNDGDIDVFMSNSYEGIGERDSIAFNTQPISLGNSAFTVGEGDTLTLSASNIIAVDLDTPPEFRTFTLETTPVNGNILLDDVPLNIGQSFTQGDVETGRVKYGHDDSRTTSDTFNFAISDGFTSIAGQTATISVTLANEEAPVEQTNTGITVTEGFLLEIETSNLEYSDFDSPVSALTYNVQTAPAHGILVISPDLVTPVTSFTQLDINNGNLLYQHDGSETTSDSFNFNVTDGLNTAVSSTFNITVNPANDSPEEINNTGLVMDEGESLVITPDLLLYTDPDNDSTELIYSVTSAADFGQFENIGDPGTPISSFSQADIDNNEIVFFHDDSENFTDQATLSLTDGAINITGIAINITINPVNDNPPVIDPAGPFEVPENTDIGTLVGTPITFTDIDAEPATDYTYSIVEPVPFSIDTAGQIRTTGAIDFQAAASYDLTILVNDGVQNSAGEVVTINVEKSQLESDSTMLIALYNANGGGEWTNNSGWLSGDLDSWFGVTVTGGAVTALNLTLNGLTGDFDISGDGLDSLTTLNISSNKIETVIGIESKTVLTTVNIADNELDFADLTDGVLSGSYDITYSPQKPALDPLRELVQIGSDYVVDRTVPGGETYVWLRDGAAIGETTSSFTIPITDFSDEAEYIAQVTNSSAPELTITTDPINIIVSSLERDSASLRIVYAAIVNPSSSISDWTSTPIADWAEVTIANNRVTELNLENTGVSGDVPIELADVEGLTSIDLSDNNLSGLPNFTGTLTNVTSFDITNNDFEFDDLDPNAARTGLDFNPQNPKSVASNSVVIEQGTAFELSEPIEGAEEYQWKLQPYRAETLPANIAGATSDTYGVSEINFEDMGNYTLTATSSATEAIDPNFEIVTEPIEVLATADIFGVVVDPRTNIGLTVGSMQAFETIKGQPYDTVQTVSVTAGEFRVENLILGNYVCITEVLNNEEFVPTYVGNTEDWILADTLEVRSDFEVPEGTYTMILRPDDFVEGPGTLDMLVESDFAEEDARIEARRRVRKAGCSLRRRVTGGGGRIGQNDDEYVLVAYKETDDQGNVSFGNIPPGFYRINIQYPGVPMDETSNIDFEIEEGRETEFDANVTVTEEGISVELQLVLSIIREYFTDLQVYPNPADESFTLKYKQLISENVQMQMFSLSGSIVKEIEMQNGFDQEIEVRTQELEEGIYILRFVDDKSGESVMTYKVVVKH